MVGKRSESQIDAAKRAQTARLGQSGAQGKQKRCKKGKSCGASCISSAKFCLVDLPWVTSNQVAKVAKKIQGRVKPAPKAVKKDLSVDELKNLIMDHHLKLRQAVIDENGKEYTKQRSKIIAYKKEMDKKTGSSVKVPMPTWTQVAPIVKELKDAAAKGDLVKKEQATEKLKALFLGKAATPAPKPSPTPPPPKPAPQPKATGGTLPKLSTTSEYADALSSTRGLYSSEIKRAHSFLEKLLGYDITSLLDNPASPDEKPKFDSLRDALLKRFKSGSSDGTLELREAFKSLQSFTGNNYTYIRDIQRGIPISLNVDRQKYLKQGENIEKLLKSPEMDRPNVIKFRGISVNQTTLDGMIESAKIGGTYGGGATSSWSTTLDTAQYFSGKNLGYQGNSERVIFRTVNKVGVPVGSVSLHSGEHEVLTSKDANYKYVGYNRIVYNGIPINVFDVEES